MEVVNGTAVQVPHHRRAILNKDAVATRLLGWRRKVGAIGVLSESLSLTPCRQPKPDRRPTRTVRLTERLWTVSGRAKDSRRPCSTLPESTLLFRRKGA